MKNKRNYLIISHKFLTQPDDDLVMYLNNKQSANVVHITHSFSDAKDRKSYIIWYKEGKIFFFHASRDYKILPEFLIYFKELFFTTYYVFRLKLKFDYYIGLDGLCTIFGIFISRIFNIRKIIYWAIDYVPYNRFKSKLKNSIYRYVNRFSYTHASEVWDLGLRMPEAREKYLGLSIKDYKFHRHVPYGVWTNRIKKKSYDNCNKNTLVFMGHLLEKQGAQLVIQAMPSIIKRNPMFIFKIIGDGQYKEELISKAKSLRVYNHCKFLGKIDNIQELEEQVASSCIAIAPYIKQLDLWTKFTDPGKVKTYIACGVPILLTDLPWNSKDIEKNRCGIIITQNIKDIIENIFKLMDRSVNENYRGNCIKYAEKFNYENIFKKIF